MEEGGKNGYYYGMRESTVVSWSYTRCVSRGGGFTAKADKDGNKHGMKVVITVRYF